MITFTCAGLMSPPFAIWRLHPGSGWPLRPGPEAVSTWTREPDDAGGNQYNTTAYLSPGFRRAINLSNSQIVWGLAAPIGLTNDSPDYGVFLYFSYEHVFIRGVSFFPPP